MRTKFGDAKKRDMFYRRETRQRESRIARIFFLEYNANARYATPAEKDAPTPDATTFQGRAPSPEKQVL